MANITTRLPRGARYHVTLAKADDLLLDDAAGKWVVVCDGHGEIVNVDTSEAAWKVHPIDFCGECQWEEDNTSLVTIPEALYDFLNAPPRELRRNSDGVVVTLDATEHAALVTAADLIAEDTDDATLRRAARTALRRLNK